ncbi:MAG TPA: response regulator [Ktedonobacteraceae bacterium]
MQAHILVIDDDTTVLEMMRYAMEGEGYRVTTSPSYFDELKEIEDLQLDLIILDFKIRGRNTSWTFLQKVRLHPPTAQIPIFLCTAGLSDVREQEDILREKGIPVLYKPFSLAELFDLIHTCLIPPASTR